MQVLNVKTRQQFYSWLMENHDKALECYVPVKRGNPSSAVGILSYLDAVECALCFGWIDSTLIKVDNVTCNRFSPRRKNSPWTELNKERCRRLIRLGEMTEAGLKCCPNLDEEFVYPKRIIDVIEADRQAYEFFCSCPSLYKNIRIQYIEKSQNEVEAIEKLIENCRQKKMFGQWNDYGRLE